MVAVSQTASDVRAEFGVVSRSQYADTVHRQDPAAEDPTPACGQATASERDDYRRAGIAVVTPHYQPCQNPECFGPADPQQAHICAGGVADRPIRIQTFQVAIAAAVFGETPIARSDVQTILGVSESRRGSLKRGLADARDAGWLEYDDGARAYRAGPLAEYVDGGGSR